MEFIEEAAGEETEDLEWMNDLELDKDRKTIKSIAP